MKLIDRNNTNKLKQMSGVTVTTEGMAKAVLQHSHYINFAPLLFRTPVLVSYFCARNVFLGSHAKQVNRKLISNPCLE